MDPVALLGRFFPTVGLLGAEALWFAVYVWGRWRPWPARIHVLNGRRHGGGIVRDGRTGRLSRHPWTAARGAWLLAGMVAALLHLVLLGWTAGFF